MTRHLDRFLMITQMRAGTGLLVTALASHPEIVMRQVNGLKNGLKEFEGRWGNSHCQGVATHQWCDFYAQEVFGLDGAHFWRTLAEQFPRTIILSRENLLRRYLSGCIAWASPGSGFDVMRPRTVMPQVHFDLEDFLATVKENREIEDRIKQAFPRALVMTYEELCQGWRRALLQVQTYLGVSPLRLRRRTFRQETRPVSEIIANWSPGLERALQERGFGRWVN